MDDKAAWYREGLHLIDGMAPKYVGRFQDDICSAARERLVGLVDAFDPERGVPFGAYARRRLAWAMVDENRRMLGRTGARRTFRLSAADTLNPDPRPGPEQLAVTRSEVAQLEQAVTGLRQRNAALLVAWYYRDGLTQQEIGDRLGLTEGRISQLLTAIRGDLRRALKGTR